MTGYELVLLWFAWILGGGSPGPATLGIASTSMNTGRRMGLMFSLGILFGSAFWGVAAALGMSAVMMTNVWVFEVIRYAGAGYLLYLAVKSLRSALSAKNALMGKAQSGTAWKVFTKGALIHLTNPKAILGWGAIYAIALPSTAAVGDLFWMFGFLYSGSILVFVGYAFMFSSSGVVRIYTRLRRWFEGAFALLFGAASLKILTAKVV
ncbi:LysE family transporter [uncultured Litoreibacter sp.]|uniref:LysE family translocator n=1 Tax=uncultured Litoreibacter sp. TaxID=1392394 RepID=UPI0026398063|nr:LysE family transporter [uncultured Litoreibacter sp.]